MKFKVLDKKTVYDGYFSVQSYDIEHACFAGGHQTIKREIFERGDAVGILPYDPGKDEVLLIEQFRAGPVARDDNPWMIEIAAGMIDAGETPEECARRECVEETGFAPTSLKPLGHYYVSPGGTSERIVLFLAEIDSEQPVAEGGGLDSEHEDIRVFMVTREEAMSMLQNGRICSSIPMLALLLAFGGVPDVYKR